MNPSFVLVASPQAQDMALVDLLAQGGWAMLPIYGCSIVGLGVFFAKVFQLRAVNSGDPRWFEVVAGSLRSGNLEEAKRRAREAAHPCGRVVSAVVHAVDEQPSMAESEAKRVGSIELARLERNLPLLAFLAQIAPLLGLLGTVVGMVELFMGLQGADHGNLAIGDLAGGIWKALLTTAAGLCVAVPVLAAHAYLAGRIDAIRLELSDVVQRTLYAAGLGETEDGR